MTFHDLTSQIRKELLNAGISEGEAESNVILQHFLQRDRGWLLTHEWDEAPREVENDCMRVAAGRKNREPLAYILGVTEFYGLDFLCSPAALIPRPETELLVDLVAKHLPEKGTVLDLGCGTGCIGLSIANTRPDSRVLLTDISADALSLARSNCSRLLLDCQFQQSDWFESISEKKLDCIVTNPPYIHPDEKAALAPEVFKEPHGALFAQGPEMLYHEIIFQAADRLAENGFLLAELGPRYAAAILKIAEGVFESTAIIKDYSGHDRILFARSPRGR